MQAPTTNNNLLRNRNPDAKLTYKDGIVGALWGDSFITSPNCNYIPRPIDDSSLILRTDFYYGAHDFLLWPQPYDEKISHLTIVRKYPNPDVKELDWKMWEPYDERYFIWSAGDKCVSGYGRLKSVVAEELFASVSRLLEKVKNKELLQERGVPPVSMSLVNVSRLNLEFTFSRLKEMPCTREQANRGWVELQRVWRCLDALWEFLTVQRAIMCGFLPEANHTEGPLVSLYVGTFTHNEWVALQMFVAGIPVWLIRPVSAFTEQNILSVVELREPQLCMNIHPNPVVLAEGRADSLQKFLAIEAASHKFCLHPDPFEVAAFNSSAQNSIRTSSRPTLSNPTPGSSSNRSSRRPTPYPKVNRPKGEGHKGGRSYQKENRDKFAEWVGEFAIPAIPTWENANKKIDQNSPRVRPVQGSAGYFFPDPGLFFGVTKEWKAVAFFRQWEHIKNVWTLRIFSDSVSPCSSQEWRDILSLGIFTSRDDAPVTETAMAICKVRNLIGDCLNAVGLVEHSLSNPLPQKELELQGLDIPRARILIWELAELNFRWELQALDRRLFDKRKFGHLQRQEMLLMCFSVKYPGITSLHASKAATGLASPTFAGRFPYLQSFWRLMDCWQEDKPSTWYNCPSNTAASAEGDKWERDLVLYYVQSFFNHFNRPPILPHTLLISDISLATSKK